jgi:hypothetical protein
MLKQEAKGKTQDILHLREDRVHVGGVSAAGFSLSRAQRPSSHLLTR